MNNTATTTAPIERTPEETIAELARSAPKPSDRAQAFNALRRVIDNLPTVDEGIVDADMQLDLARLYAFFLPKPSPKARSPFEWVSKAIGKNDVRHYLNYVYVTADEIVGTDGHLLHIVPNTEGWGPGFYGAEGVRLHGPDYARYPDTMRVQPVPSAPGRQWYDVQLSDLELATVAIEKGGTFSFYKLPTAKGFEYEERVHVDAKLIKRLFSMDSDECISINVGGMGDSVLVKLSGNRTAVVMPLRQ